MDNRNTQMVIVALVAVAAGFGIAALVLSDDDSAPADQTDVTAAVTEPQPTQTVVQPTATAPTTTTTQPDSVPREELPTVANCVGIWNRGNNTTPRDFLKGLQNEQAVRVNVGATEQVPQKCLVTVIANDGNVYRFTEGGGKAFPYSPQPGRAELSQLSPQERKANALPEADGLIAAR